MLKYLRKKLPALLQPTLLLLNIGSQIMRMYCKGPSRYGMSNPGLAATSGPALSLNAAACSSCHLTKATFDADTGQQLWVHKLGIGLANPATAWTEDGKIYILASTADGYIELLETTK